ncbi:Protein GVQW1 [Plecturocebus cupreus]
MGPAEPVRPAHSAPGSAALGASKRAVPAKRVTPVTRVASPPGISRSVGNKNSCTPPGPANFVFLVEMGFHHVDQANVELLTSGDSPASASQIAEIIGSLPLLPSWSSLEAPFWITATSSYMVQDTGFPMPDDLHLHLKVLFKDVLAYEYNDLYLFESQM